MDTHVQSIPMSEEYNRSCAFVTGVVGYRSRATAFALERSLDTQSRARAPRWSSTKLSFLGKGLCVGRVADVSRRRKLLYLSASTETACVDRTKSLTRFLEGFQGDFDNYRQICDERKNNAPRAERHEHIHCKVIPVHKPDISDDALVYANYYFNGKPSLVYRQRLYAISINDSGKIRMKIYCPSNMQELIIRKYEYNFDKIELGKLGDPSEFEYLEGCDIYWREEEEEHPELPSRGSYFFGYMNGGGAIVDSKVMGGRIEVKDELVMTKEDLWVNDRAFNMDGIMLYGNMAGISYKMVRVHESEKDLAWTMHEDMVLP